MPEYIEGSKEQVVVDLSCSAPGFAVSGWTGEMAFASVGTDFDADAATWYACTLAAGATSSQFTAALMLTTDVTLAEGVWDVYVRVTKTGDSTAERPIIPVTGHVRIV